MLSDEEELLFMKILLKSSTSSDPSDESVSRSDFEKPIAGKKANKLRGHL